MTIQVFRPDPATAIYSDPGHNVIATEASGECSNFSPGGSTFSIESRDQRYLVTDMQLWSNPLIVCQWHHRKQELVLFDRRRLTVSYGNGDPFDLPDFRRADWAKQSEVTSGKLLQTIVFVRAGPVRRQWICAFNENGVQHAWEFDDAVHGGDANTNWWHNMYEADEWFVVSLSSNGPPDNPIFRVRHDGTGWQRIVFDDSEQQHRSHYTVDKDRMAAGWWIGDTPRITIYRITNGWQIAEIADRHYSHGCLRGDHLVYSVLSRQTQTDVALRLWNWQTGEDRLIADLPKNDIGFYGYARPMINNDGSQVVWHEVRNGHTVVVSRRLEETPDEPDEQEGIQELAARIQRDSARILELI